MRLSNEANERLEKLMETNALEIRDQAARIAELVDADTISATHIEKAADLIRLYAPTTKWGDVTMSTGIGLLGISAGIAGTASQLDPSQTWMWIAVFCTSIVGAFSFGLGFAIKVRK